MTYPIQPMQPTQPPVKPRNRAWLLLLGLGVAAVVAVVVSVVATRSGSTAGDTAAAHIVSAPSPSVAAPSPSAAAPTVTQYASGLNGPIKSAQSAWKQYQTLCEVDENKLACTLGPQTLGLTAKTLSITIDGMEAKQSDADTLFLGTPPAEIANLVESTRTAASTLADDLANPEKPRQGWAFDALSLMDTLDGWGPYL